MTLNDLRDDILRFSAEREWGPFHSPKNLAMSVASEAGELLEVFQWLTEDQSKQLDNEAMQAAQDEIGDVLICLTNLAARLGIDPLIAAQNKMQKNRAKYPVDKSRGRAVKYDKL